jgi:hypothetical protein
MGRIIIIIIIIAGSGGGRDGDDGAAMACRLEILGVLWLELGA